MIAYLPRLGNARTILNIPSPFKYGIIVSLFNSLTLRRKASKKYLFFAFIFMVAGLRAKISSGERIENSIFLRLKNESIPLNAIILKRKDTIKNNKLFPVFTAAKPIRSVMTMYIQPDFVIFTVVWECFAGLIVSPRLLK